jgi:thiol-disulfide isomerase/thioredoxin
MTSPRTLAGIEDARKRLADGLEQVRTTGRAWDEVAGDLAEANLQRFVDANPAWQRRLLVARRPMREPDRAALLGDLLAELVPSSRAEAERWSRLEAVSERAARADEASYRLEVRLAALLRMRAVLQDVAARTLFGRGDREARASSSAFDRLRSCEALTLPLPAPSVAREAPAEAYPSFEEEMKAAQEALPGWMGIRFQDAPPALAARLRLLRGASQIVNVFPDSPAQASGLDVGDVVLGPPGHPFQERNEVRTWTMLAAIGQPAPLEILRDGKRRTVTLVPGPRPLKWPELPGPPKLGTAAPAVRGDAFRGKLPAALAGGGEHLLLFWATWCAPCKASLPEVMAFSAERHVPVIAITDEPATTLRAFFAKWPSAKAFPEIVVSDEARRTFAAYGVSGTPTFVLVGGDGAVRGYRTGYSPADGLPVPGWRWTR